MLGGRQGYNGTYYRPQKGEKINTKFVVNRFFMKLFRTSDISVVAYCPLN